MRVLSQPVNGVTAKVYGGTTGVLLAMDVESEARKGLLGFAIERETLSGPFMGKTKWLEGLLHFPGLPHFPGQPVPSNVAPLQKFRWSDYTVYPGVKYAYTIHPAYGHPGNPDVHPGPRVEVETAGENASHFVIFNRAAAASQAFAREFPQVAIDLYAAKKAKKKLTSVQLPSEAYHWLSRGVLEHIVGFLADATDATWAVDIAIYEYELLAIREAVAKAANQGAKVRILYHAKPGDGQTADNKASLKKPALPKANVLTVPRPTQKIMHDKFIVLSKLVNGQRDPQAVLCGSTNFTENGVFRQANVVHIASDPDIAGQYLAQFETLLRTAKDPKQTKVEVTQNNPIPSQLPIFVGFSPRSGQADLKEFVKIIQGAKRDVLFCTVFKLFADVQSALLGKPHDDILRYGLQNTRSTITGYHKDRTANFAATAYLSEGLEGWLKESTAGQKGNILVHTKLVVVDFTSDAPIVISGSHNLSKPASEDNDENFLIIRSGPGETDIADVYGVELMRLYDHYRFRWYVAHDSKKAGSSKKDEAPTLDLTDAWTKSYFGTDKLKTADRLRFIGKSA